VRQLDSAMPRAGNTVSVSTGSKDIDPKREREGAKGEAKPTKRRSTQRRRRPWARLLVILGVLTIITISACGWLAYRANELRIQLTAANSLLPEFKSSLLAKDSPGAEENLDQIRMHTAAAQSAARDPLWLAAGGLPWIGPNFSALTEIALSATDIVNGAGKPLLGVYNSVEWETLTPVNGTVDLAPLVAASPSMVTAANTVELTYARLATIDRSRLLTEVSGPVDRALGTLDDIRSTLSMAADTSRILPSMLGSDGARNYLVLVQNNAEVRATGGLPGALAIIHVENGVMRLESQTSGAALGRFTPTVGVDSVQRSIYTDRLGTFISDVNLTPDFPTAAMSAKEMWETRYKTQIDGVLAIDPVVLSHILEASGPIVVPTPKNVPAASLQNFPDSLTASNVVQTLLADVYLKINSNVAQDAYFASASSAIFDSLASGNVSGKKLLEALATSATEGRLYIWSAHTEEQNVLKATGVGGAVSGVPAGGTSFGVYFNDGTGAKMDYYVRRSVQLVEVCTNDDYAEFKVRVKLTNSAPSDAGTSFPTAVTGGGVFGVPPGSVQTNTIVYGPALSYADSTLMDGAKVSFGSYMHATRPVGTVTTRLDPGQSSEVEMTFVKIAQRGDPTLDVTPTVQDVKDVVLPTEQARCE
jgi:hypothetical protein